MSRGRLVFRALVGGSFVFVGLVIAGAMFIIGAACLIIIAGILS